MNNSGTVPSDKYRELSSDFLTRIDGELHFLNSSSRSRLSRQVMAKWLGDCPLDF